MAIPDFDNQTARRTGRDLAAVALIVLGLGGLLVVAVSWDWRAVLALVSLIAIAAGVTLGLDR